MLSKRFTSTLSAISDSCGKAYNPLNRLVRRVREKMKRFRDAYFIIFAIILAASLTFITNMENLSSLWLWLSSGRIYLRVFLVIVIIGIIYLALRQLWREISKVDNTERLKGEEAIQKLVKASVEAAIEGTGIKTLIQELPNAISSAVKEGVKIALDEKRQEETEKAGD